MKTYRFFLMFFILAAGWAGPARGAAKAPADLLRQADALRAEKSFRMAREIYDEVLGPKSQADPEQKNHARVMGLDCLWRERTGEDGATRADKELGRLVEDLPESSPWRAEAAESLGDLRAEAGRWPQPRHAALAPWLIALKHWGEAVNLKEARPRYIALNFKIAEYALRNAQEGFFPFPEDPVILRIGILPPPPPKERIWEGDLTSWALRNVLRVSQAPAERARALFLLGAERAGTPPGDPKFKARDERWTKEAEEYLKQAAEIRPRNEWTDRALWELAQFFENRQRYIEAARAVDRILREFDKSETAFYDQAVEMLKRLTTAQAAVQAGDAFAPGSYIRLQIDYRNVNRITLRLLRVKADDFIAAQRTEHPEQMLRGLTGEQVKEMPVEGIVDEKKHEPHVQVVFVDPLPAGIYLAEIDASGPAAPDQPRRALFRVSRLAVAGRTVGDADQVFVVDAETGRPLTGVRVRALYKTPPDQPRLWEVREGVSGDGGIAAIERPQPDQTHRGVPVAFFAEMGGQFATTQHWGWWVEPLRRGGGEEHWVLYTETDRPAYRPDEPIQWKATLRTTDGKGYSLPSLEKAFVSIRDARGQVAYEVEDLEVSAYGTVSGSFKASRRVALGMLSIEIKNRRDGETLAAGQLCRLEEYKLPEYKVAVEPGREQVRFGDAASFAVAAEYYFGGPVAGADVEVVVHRRAFWPGWHPPRPYPWLYESGGEAGRMAWMPWIWPRIEPEQIVLTRKLKTDAQGKVRIEAGALSAEEVKQARDRGIWGYEFRVEARVVDSSRREVRASGSVKTALTAFAAYLTPQRYLYLPGDPVKIDLKTLDPNDQPLGTEGIMTMFKRAWNEARVNAKGEKEPGYDDTKLLARPAVTGAKDGAATVEFTPDEPGCYLFRFETRDKFGEPVKGETVVFVADRATRQTGYRSGGVTIVTDKETYAPGETAHVLLTVRRPGAAVWFGVEGEAIHELKVVPLEGTVKMVDVPVTAEHEPNFFVTAVAMFDYGAFQDTRRLVVPPKEQFLNITLVAPKETFKPGEKALVKVRVRDNQDRPVQTELSLGVADAAVWAIQGDVGEDILKAFWSRMRGLNFQVSSSPAQTWTQYWRPRPGKSGEYEEDVETTDRRDSDAVDKLSLGDRSGRQIESAPVPSAAPMAGAPMKMMRARGDVTADAAGGEAMAPVELRTDFSSTALWLPALTTGEDGTTSATVTFPDSLTTWKLTARAADERTRVGEVRNEVRTTKKMLVRPQGPRFFTEGDTVVLSAIVNNNTSQSLPVDVSLEAEGLTLARFDEATTAGASRPDEASAEPVRASEPKARIVVPALGQRRVDWRARAGKPGEAVIKTTALSTVESDAVQKRFPIYEYGIEQFIASGAVLKGFPDIIEKKIVLNLPAGRRTGSERLTLWLEPTLTRSMLSALDYLAQYPYGCVEQTVSRFVPAVITIRVLRQFDLRKPELEEKVTDMVNAGIARLAEFQHQDGGWGWWKEDASDLYMTAYVLQGLGQAVRAEIGVEGEMLTRGERYLTENLVKAQNQPDLTAFILYALAMTRSNVNSPVVKMAHDRLWEDREKLDPYSRALFIIATFYTGQPERSATLARNMRNGVIQDKENGTAHWGRTGIYRRWSEGAVESTAFALRALLLVEPESELVDQAMTWLVRNRRGNRWESTKDTAIAIRALADYVRFLNEDKPTWRAEVEVNGRRVTALRVSPNEVFNFEGKVEVPADALRDGENTIVIRRSGSGTLYASAWLTYFTREEEIKPAGNEVFAERRFWRTRQEPTLSGTVRTTREELRPGMALKSGDRVEVELTLEAKNDYEYLVVEDLKAAGMETTEVQSGADWGGGLAAHRELRDEKTAFFITRLPQGKHTLKYELRAEIPGVFSALPTTVYAMYVPEIRGNGSGAKVEIRD